MAGGITFRGGSKRSARDRRLFGDDLRVHVSGKADAVTQRLTAAYVRAWGKMHALAREMAQIAAEAKHSGRALSPREIARMDRVDRAQFALERQVRELGKFTGVQVTGAATNGLGRFAADVLDQIPSLAGIDRRFTKPSGAAMQGLVLRTEGQITSATRALTARQEVDLKNGLFRGLVLGENPEQTARHILDNTETAFFGGLPAAKTIARTEIADAHRYATRMAYNDSDLVIGWKWLASLGPRTCPACWALHNTFHEKTELQYAHQNCRCTMVPVLVDDDVSQTDLGDPEQIFWGLPREQQLQIMGPGRLKALEGGAPFSSLAFLKHNPDWRPANYSTSVADLTGLANLHLANTVGDVLGIPGQTNQSILDMAFHQGGLTIQARSGEQPTSGVAVAQPGASGVFDAREFFGPSGPLVVSDWMIQHGDALDSPTAHMGVWYDHANGKVVLDVVDVIADREEAIALGKQRDQIAVFDLGTFEEINTGGTGGYANPGEAIKITDPDIGRTVKVTVRGALTEGRVIDHDLSNGTVVVKADDGFIYTVKHEDIAEFTSPPITKDRVLAVHDISTQATKDTGIKVDLTGADPASAQEAADALRGLVSTFPDIKPREAGVDPDFSKYPGLTKAYAVTITKQHPAKPDGSSSRIAINGRYMDDYQRFKSIIAEDVEGGFHPKGAETKPIRFSVQHEYGHVLDNALWAEGAVSQDRQNMIGEVMEALGQPTGPQPIKVNEKRNEAVKKDLSVYGSMYGPEEMIGEAVGAYLANGPGKSIAADTIMRHIVRRYEAQFGHPPNLPHLEELMEGK